MFADAEKKISHEDMLRQKDAEYMSSNWGMIIAGDKKE